jgi:hypothetical protein
LRGVDPVLALFAFDFTSLGLKEAFQALFNRALQVRTVLGFLADDINREMAIDFLLGPEKRKEQVRCVRERAKETLVNKLL